MATSSPTPNPEQPDDGAQPTIASVSAHSGFETRPLPGGEAPPPLITPTGSALRPAPMPNVIAQYELLEQIGRGAMGVVYKAQHTLLARKVALKIMREDLARDDQFTQRFIREARLAAAVDSPYVVTVYDAGNFEGFLYIAMRYVSGGEVAQLVQLNGGRLALDPATRIIADCAQGLCDIHEAGLIHRDIKPSNILLQKNGSARIADLGLARAVAESSELTSMGQTLGTPAFMAPEQVRGTEDLDIRADIYSLGATWYRILTGRTPYDGKNAIEMMARVLYEPIPDPRQFQPDLPQEVVDVLMRCIAREPKDRYESSEELVKAITQLQQSYAMTTSAVLRKKGDSRPDSESNAMSQTGAVMLPSESPGTPQAPNPKEDSQSSSSGKTPSSFFGFLSNLFRGSKAADAPLSSEPPRSTGSSIFRKLSVLSAYQPPPEEEPEKEKDGSSQFSSAESGAQGDGSRKGRRKKAQFYRGRRVDE